VPGTATPWLLEKLWGFQNSLLGGFEYRNKFQNHVGHASLGRIEQCAKRQDWPKELVRCDKDLLCELL
jgi:hypothetical protein